MSLELISIDTDTDTPRVDGLYYTPPTPPRTPRSACTQLQ